MDVVVNGERGAVLDASKALDSQGDYYRNILSCLNYEPKNPPLADLLRHYHQLKGQWLIASPIHWEATHNDAMIIATGTELELSEEESRLWFTEVATFLKTDNFSPQYHDAGTWLFNRNDKPAIKSIAPNAALNLSLMPIFAGIGESFYWQRLLTELQMFLGSHPLNAKREGKLSVNGLWFWGEGSFELTENKVIVTDDEVLITLAASQSLPIGVLNTTTLFDKNQLLIINNPQTIALNQIEEKTKKMTVNWYWNNVAYIKPAQRWWSRIGI